MPRTKRSRAKSKRYHPYKHDDGMEIAKPTVETAGKLKQRHNLEWKIVRKEIQDLKNKRKKCSKRTAFGKEERKRIGKEMKKLKQDMESRHAKELEEHNTKQDEENTQGTNKEQTESTEPQPKIHITLKTDSISLSTPMDT